MSVFDEIAEKSGDTLWDKWKDEVLGVRAEVASFVACRLDRGAGEVVDWFEGSFNFCLRVEFKDGGADAIIRFPGPGHTTFRDEKVANEVQVIKFLHERTNIPVPKLLSWGLSQDSLHHFGPFIISEFVHGIHLSDILKDPASPAKLYLNPNVDTQILDDVFEQMANILLELFQFNFSRIGAVSKDPTSATWSVTGRPLTYSMNELATTAFYPVDKFATDPFTTASGYFRHLCQENLTHLFTQRNLSTSRKQAEEHYVARHLFARLVNKHCICDNGPFKLFCDDLRPQNILIDPKSHRITAVLDLEFTNAMPSQFATEPPWWLLLAGPDAYLIRGRSMEDFLLAYEPRLEQFLQAMQRVEKSRGMLHSENSLSSLMRESWDTKRFWFNYAARKPFDVDVLFYNCLHEISTGVDTLDEHVRAALAPFVKMKMEQLRAYDEDCNRLL
ncbi:phosphotransferase enzyme family protein [Metarhizium acridum CQMa 102]|uniref:Phosphotransferase enzyme family protein n=1 Tax=Metarhizium acridum (strain CQMa 102) TaxID=655827 RepID=E9DUE2_METAQ|nr:phosphotransferase enzyme family protein [Metarhizium acridum CQMa 102]EFY92604.1 phosphotransferase enzyme family protein [Metarhizium acridum CQMa 102]